MQERSILMKIKDIKEWEHKKILKSRRRRASKKPLNKVGFEYKDRKGSW